jgi:hypothetical protein
MTEAPSQISACFILCIATFAEHSTEENPHVLLSFVGLRWWKIKESFPPLGQAIRTEGAENALLAGIEQEVLDFVRRR